MWSPSVISTVAKSVPVSIEQVMLGEAPEVTETTAPLREPLKLWVTVYEKDSGGGGGSSQAPAALHSLSAEHVPQTPPQPSGPQVFPSHWRAQAGGQSPGHDAVVSPASHVPSPHRVVAAQHEDEVVDVGEEDRGQEQQLGIG